MGVLRKLTTAFSVSSMFQERTAFAEYCGLFYNIPTPSYGLKHASTIFRVGFFVKLWLFMCSFPIKECT